MNFTINKNKRRIGAGLLLTLFTLYVGAIVAFYHTNVVNGRLVAHSHPDYTHTHHQEHHTTSELVFLHQVSHIIVSGEIVPKIEIGRPLVMGTLLLPSLESSEYSIILLFHHLRAPPMAA